MKAMVLVRVGQRLQLVDYLQPTLGAGELRLRIEACAVCRTDLHVVDGDLANPKLPLIPGHEIVGMVEAVGEGVDRSRIGRRVGVAWLGHTCGSCCYCVSAAENLCDQPLFTGYTRDGGFATHTVADAAYAFDLDLEADPVSLAPLLCAGLIGWRSLKRAGDGKRIGIYGFGAAAHIITQVARWQGRQVFAFTRTGDRTAQDFARSLGAVWAGGSDEQPGEPLDAAIIFAPVGELVPAALRAVRKGGRVVCGGIYMSDIPAIPYRLLWEERELVSVANLTRRDAEEFFPIARLAGVRTHTKTYPLVNANDALADLRSGKLSGAAVLVP
ncbi:MAG: zinc-binding alcohol dehydrogenase family protein [Mesorhizobium sp.]|uniref:zinc-dependent alcohol dehydrogenase family protein n=1 Tax=unclassified Mesorhizobium TaxID=325217 RepID=UPI000FCBDCAA|nr:MULTISPECIES: zinc-dependent alcohol dehydrogenase family protein [unclassified Mesorhizobium]RUV74812.1 zinc-binding alcohol dehydrogenase family protein [Mesorhizobium sp. M5C.F.Cr.IN.023.01.1.1]RWF88680.1 MAG: zinc-binding alcohol dehydrogenase family protein [Mesorhizobium sp.]RWF92928.1 MAG: zinc-binding alcohol dehydrogenase family protein [Mesorhizobium sp.]RWI41251.1 MAG: zinc-binding alcohol dehydrogenase family protein [Mesorhizobium sp.]RWI49757.1 MAG: zinc-binding alcohol dehydr